MVWFILFYLSGIPVAYYLYCWDFYTLFGSVRKEDKINAACIATGSWITVSAGLYVISFTRLITFIMKKSKSGKGLAIIELILSIAPAIISIFKKKK